ncbi:peroxisomal membrane protein PEX16 [Coprinopsis marcescibilis]|uniref:Peroxisomal membrane protein PEX16 n=1 Tax=Coprinopsis marcescibilis TaxID=230819 RepID=A0A5C3LCC5_COPMA|nr:peroxisomal membrane protein PEX16 [Coprinopsis marcescibilis]
MVLSKTQYESFLINNVSTISSLESTLRSITWFLPGRFKDAELASEALTTLLNVVSMYHDTLLARVVQNNPSYKPLIPLSLHTRFTRSWLDKSSQYKWISRSLEIIRFTELVVEMLLRRKVSEKTKWRCIVSLEVIKYVAALRLWLLKITRRPLVSPLIPERDFDPTTLPPSSESSASSVSASQATLPLETPEHLRNNQSPLPPHALLAPNAERSDTAAKDYLVSKALTTASVKPSPSLIRTLSGPRDWLAEIIHVLRPLIYVSLLVVDKKSARPTNRALITALVMEFLARNLRRTPSASATLERAEYAKRDKDMLWYLLRGSIWETYTRPKLAGFVDRIANKPLLGLLGAFVHDWIPLIDDYYYCKIPSHIMRRCSLIFFQILHHSRLRPTSHFNKMW